MLIALLDLCFTGEGEEEFKMSNLEIDRVSMDIEVIVPLLSQKLGYLLAPEGNIYSSSTEQDRITETKSVLDRISTKIRVAGNNWASSDPAGLSRSDFLSKINELEEVIDTFIVKTELWRRKSFIKIMPHLIYQIRLSHVMDKLITYARTHLPQEDNTGSTAATDPHTQPTQPRNVEDQAPDDSDFVGLEDKKDELLEKLFYAKDQESDNVIAVTGNAGSGKTVLTKKIYYGQYVKRGFNHRAWVGISEDFEAREVLLNILMELGWKRKDEILSDNDLEMMLKSYLKEKRCLIVVDDVRTHYDWEKLSVILKCVGGWSRLILTTRNIDIAHAANPWRNPIVLRSLTDDESWTLFLKKAQIENDSLNSQDLIHLKEDILKKCGGSPLAIIVLGGLLSTTELSGWPKVIEQLRKTDLRESSTVTKPAVQQSSTTDIRESSTVSKPAVRQLSTTTTSVPEPAYQENIITFSYQNLPSRMKLCVLYFGLFPRASEIRIRRLFHLWLAEGLVIPLPKDEMATEDPAEKYLQLLIERKLIKKEKMRLDGSPKTCSMPGGIWDVFHKMAVDLRRFNDISTACKSAESPNIRRLVKDPNTDNHSFFDPYNKNYSSLVHHIQNLRSYVSFDTRKRDLPTKEIEMFINAVVTKRGFGLLVVLDLENVYKPMLPETLGKLLHLKYLGLRWTFLDSLPKSVGNLPYLETLDVKYTNIISLPNSIWKAKNLQHLYLNEIHFDMSVKKPNSGSLTKLQTLWGLFIGSEDLVENFLSKLTDLRKLKLTCTPQSECAIAEWILSKLKNLQSLKLRSINEFGRPSTLSLNAMEEHQKLCDLYLLGQLPEEAQLQFPPNLKILTLSGSQLEKDPMPILGQLPHLEILRLLRDSYSGTRMTCLDSGFPELRKLKLWMLNNLEEWIVNNGSMPRLEELEIRHCVKWKQPGLDLTNNLEKVKKVILTNMRREFVANVEKAIGQGKVKEVTLPLKVRFFYNFLVLVLHYSSWQFF
nr:putative inactive disease susceptibility protein LOV1 [Quercus suber]